MSKITLTRLISQIPDSYIYLFILKSLHARNIDIFISEFVILGTFMKKGKVAWRNFKNLFSRPLFTIIFRQKIVFLDTGLILRVRTIYESVK